MKRNGIIEVYNESTNSHDPMHPETNWDQVLVAKGKTLRQYLEHDVYAVGVIHHNFGKMPLVQTLVYDYGAGVAPFGDGPVGGTDGKIDPFTGIEHVDSNTIVVKIAREYEEYGDVTITKNTDKDEYYISFANSEKCVCIMLGHL